jgi:hypothetical protein
MMGQDEGEQSVLYINPTLSQRIQRLKLFRDRIKFVSSFPMLAFSQARGSYQRSAGSRQQAGIEFLDFGF